jgi:hypothetical protein
MDDFDKSCLHNAMVTAMVGPSICSKSKELV